MATVGGQDPPAHYRLVRSKAACKLRVRVGPNGVEVIRPASRKPEDAAGFLRANGAWIAGQMDRVTQFRERKPLLQLAADSRP